MQKFLGQNIANAEERKDFLKANCNTIEEIGYTRRFTEQEMRDKKEQLANASISIHDTEAEKKEAAAHFKEILKPLTEQKDTLLRALKEKSEFVRKDCYKFIEYEERLVGFYNDEGELVDARPILGQEIQRTFVPLRTGTND